MPIGDFTLGGKPYRPNRAPVRAYRALGRVSYRREKLFALYIAHCLASGLTGVTTLYVAAIYTASAYRRVFIP